MPYCNLPSKVLPVIGCLCASPCLYFGIPLLLWPIGEWITWGDNSFELTCGNQWRVDVYYSPKDTFLTCRDVIDQVTVKFTGTPPANGYLKIYSPSSTCPYYSTLQTAVVTDGSDADKALKTEELTKLGSLHYYVEVDSKSNTTTCRPGGVYKVNSPGAKLWVKENGFTSGFNAIVQSVGVTVFIGGACACIFFWSCIGLFVCLLSEDPSLRAVQLPPQMQMQGMQMGQVQMHP